jgi:hypothetical protein
MDESGYNVDDWNIGREIGRDFFNEEGDVPLVVNPLVVGDVNDVCPFDVDAACRSEPIFDAKSVEMDVVGRLWVGVEEDSGSDFIVVVVVVVKVNVAAVVLSSAS